VVTIEPEGAAIMAAKILALEDETIRKLVKKHQLLKKKILSEANQKIKNLK